MAGECLLKIQPEVNHSAQRLLINKTLQYKLLVDSCERIACSKVESETIQLLNLIT